MLLALIMALSLVACGNGGSSADADAKTVVYWSVWESTEPQGQAIAATVENFTKETGIKVDLQFKGRTGIREGLQPALDAGQVIDVFDEDIDRINTTFAPYLLDLEELASLGYFSANIESNVWPNGQNVELAGGSITADEFIANMLAAAGK